MMSDSPLHTCGAYEAKTHFSQLLERVAAGEEITITRHGHPVARLVPATPGTSLQSRRNAIDRMRQLSSGQRLDGLRIQDLIAEGRK
ncbi:type II toxin-antitoxin system Phd/YefM family antitoxin [Planctomicrobium sp. SH661]|uniref:type II toxin-antitoxin system Phd/YefM family antitoxin n=1 Tax=Planctomicrobium sp. SH661 TaxID=3448124 RepID=UPI003F5B3B13